MKCYPSRFFISRNNLREIVKVKCLYATLSFLHVTRTLAKKNNNEKVTILIVDDGKNIDILKVSGRSVERAGFNVHPFADPPTALHHVQNDCKNLPSLVVSDIGCLH